MNCPCHIQVFNQGLKSTKIARCALAEFGSCHRNEASGALHSGGGGGGTVLMRVGALYPKRCPTKSFCEESDIQKRSVENSIDLFNEVYQRLGFTEIYT